MTRHLPTLESAELPSLDDVNAYGFIDESVLLQQLLPIARLTHSQQERVSALARQLVMAARAGRRKFGGVDAFMHEYGLSSEEGVTLMCLAEALLRIPDSETADKLIADKIGGQAWDKHLGKSDWLFVNASTWGLMLTGQVVELGTKKRDSVGGWLSRLVSASGEPVIRQAMRHAMRIMGRQFVLGRSIEEAIERGEESVQRGYRFSFDMLGEAAVTAADAARYTQSYHQALQAVASWAGPADTSDAEAIFARPSISVKLSALHPRFDAKAGDAMARALRPIVLDLARAAKAQGLGLTIDAEEAERLELTLEMFAALRDEDSLRGWHGLGLAVQAYSRRAYMTLRWLSKVAEGSRHRLCIRLVKGAYWDNEIKRAQEAGLSSFPVFTRKASTDVSYLACARYLLNNRSLFFPQFATHNAHSAAAVEVVAGGSGGYEFQRLHGMGQALYDELTTKRPTPCRIYAPVGSHEDLLAYLVRRLLENGANSSFVNRLADDDAPLRDIIADPVDQIGKLGVGSNPAIAAPSALFAPRKNSAGFALWDSQTRNALQSEIRRELSNPHHARPLINGQDGGGAAYPVRSPHDRRIVVGDAANSATDTIADACKGADKAAVGWDGLGGQARGEILDRASDLYEQNSAKLLALLMAEAGKTLDNAAADLREAVDFLRYYSDGARQHYAIPQALPGPTGETNMLRMHGRGVFACIAPWNFPLAIFTGQVAAALAAGNSVVTKPAEQTPLIAYHAVKLLHAAGVPEKVLHLVLGGGDIGAALVADPRISGVAFTGSNATAAAINQRLAGRPGSIIPLIAETGGINAMIVDSSALPEQTTRDIIRSAFDSAGQRCSALRVLYIQDDIADKLITMISGAMEALTIGDPIDYRTDVGPVIDDGARRRLEAHKAKMRSQAGVLCELPLPDNCANGCFVAPALYEISGIRVLPEEVFGPILHVVRYNQTQLAKVCEDINATGYGLTLGIHSRILHTADEVIKRARVGNIYVNRNQIGAIVGSQPFGGEGLSGTGPKAGGPHYLARFGVERVVSTDTTASGGNASLMSLDDNAA